MEEGNWILKPNIRSIGVKREVRFLYYLDLFEIAKRLSNIGM